jgi:hypothetical protein
LTASTQQTLAERIAAKEKALTTAREAMATNADRFAGCSRLRGKQHEIRGNAQLRHGAALADTVQRLERELATLLQQPERPTLEPLDLSKLRDAKLIRTRLGIWYEVVKVNAKSVKVKAAPGMDDRVSVSKIVEIRTHEEWSLRSGIRPEPVKEG